MGEFLTFGQVFAVFPLHHMRCTVSIFALPLRLQAAKLGTRHFRSTPFPTKCVGSSIRIRSTSGLSFRVLYFSGAGDLVVKNGASAGSSVNRLIIRALPF